MRRILRRAVLPRARGEDGFGLIEAMMAMAILFGTTLAMITMAAAAFAPTALARQRQTATGLADQAMEQIRALPFDTLKRGLGNTDLSGTSDPNIVKNCAGVTGDYCYGTERIPHGVNASEVPLVPHQQTRTIHNVAFTVSSYVSYYQNVTTTNTFRVTVIVSWTSPEVRRASQVQIQTVVNSPAGCLSTATHPFSAPCQPFLYANAIQSQGSIVVTGSVGGDNLDHSTLWTTSDSSNLSIEQISNVLSNVISSGEELQLEDSDLEVVGKTTTSASADNDPSEPANDFQSVSAPSETSGTLTAGSGLGTFSVTSNGGDAGTSTSTTTATYPSPAYACADTGGVPQNDAYPCASSSIRQGTNTTPHMLATAAGDGGASAIGSWNLADIGAAPSAGVAYANRDVASGDGTVHAETTRSLGNVSLANLPSGLTAPTGWNGYLVRLTGFTDAVMSETGVNAAKPTVSASGTISYWNGTGYSTMSVSPGAPTPIPVAALHLSYQLNGNSVTVDVAPALSTGGTVITDPAGCASTCTRTMAEAQSFSPILGDISYAVMYSGASVCNLNVHVDLGSITAKTDYQAAPSA